jgi:hypothetical protein
MFTAQSAAGHLKGGAQIYGRGSAGGTRKFSAQMKKCLIFAVFKRSLTEAHRPVKTHIPF